MSSSALDSLSSSHVLAAVCHCLQPGCFCPVEMKKIMFLCFETIEGIFNVPEFVNNNHGPHEGL
jgi:hypothetical protein